METLHSFSNHLINTVRGDFFRFLFSQINWKQRMIAITGPRGAGKTTLMLQQIRFGLKHPPNVLYLTADHPWFYNHTLLETADEFTKNEGKFLFIDEVHKYANWSRELKNIYDGFPELRIVFSASSALNIYRGEADLSRRVVTYHLPGMSFREYMEFAHARKHETVTLKDVMKHHEEFSHTITNGFHPLPAFLEYLKTGYLPFFKEGAANEYHIRLLQIVNTVIDTDLSYIEGYSPASALKVKKLLGVLAESAPFQPNISSLSAKLGISRDSIYHYLESLKNARLLNFLSSQARGIAVLQKPEKLYLENTNLSYALKKLPEIGTIRETFIVNQLISGDHEIYYPRAGDVQVEHWVIELGGKSKSSFQPAEHLTPVIAADGIETGFRNKIPLWLFGFLY